MIELSAKVEFVVRELFAERDQNLVMQMLQTDCADNIVGCGNKTSHEMDRIRLSALKLSKGKIAELEAAIKLAKTDWRDLFMAAGFGHDPTAHESWLPKRGLQSNMLSETDA